MQIINIKEFGARAHLVSELGENSDTKVQGLPMPELGTTYLKNLQLSLKWYDDDDDAITTPPPPDAELGKGVVSHPFAVAPRSEITSETMATLLE
ncbi:hypothetical protein CDAR_274401 [Caerostris darwini]|uniref:Uncharacterized protein n=1 Tax=Caerostris darwini TaxID=1538125 RepID=A0AAV4RGS4_9ARAC|nr:hypothetical protein CDAR_274401 [Caerostris darwini]